VTACNIQNWLGVFSYSGQDRIVIHSYGGGVIAMIVSWTLLGLFYQVRDLRVTLAMQDGLSTENRRGLRFEIFWRVAIALLIISYALLCFLIDRGTVTLSKWEEAAGWPDGIMLMTLAIMLLIVLVSAVPFARRERRTSWLHISLWLVAAILAIILCLKSFMDYTMFPAFAHISTIGIDYAQPLKFATLKPLTYNLYASVFFWGSLLSSLVALINCLFVRCLASQWRLGQIRRWIWSGLLVVGIGTVSGFLVWIVYFGLYKLSPYLAEVGSQAPLHSWISVGLLILVIVTLITYRMVIEYTPDAKGLQVGWRRNPNKYYNEWRLVVFLLAISVVCFHFQLLYALVDTAMPIKNGSFTFIYSWSYLLENWLCTQNGFLWLSLVILALHRAFARRESAQQLQATFPSIDRARFAAVWAATLAVMVSGAMAVVWMSFALWFNPWFRGRWF
jgi:hypothetical protein